MHGAVSHTTERKCFYFSVTFNLFLGCDSPNDISALRSMFVWEVYPRSLLVNTRGICHRMLLVSLDNIKVDVGRPDSQETLCLWCFVVITNCTEKQKK
jgi:hypothetical protein